MKQPDKINIFNSTNCLDSVRMMQYLKDELAPSEKHMVERHLVDCELCTEALEGFSLILNPELIDETIQAVKELTPRKKNNESVFSFQIWLAAASIILAIVSTLLFYHKAYKPDINQVAEHPKPVVKPLEPHVMQSQKQYQLQELKSVEKKKTDETSFIHAGSHSSDLNTIMDQGTQTIADKPGVHPMDAETGAEDIINPDPVASQSEMEVSTSEGYAAEAPAVKAIISKGNRTLIDTPEWKKKQDIRYIEGLKTRVYPSLLKTRDSLSLANISDAKDGFENRPEKSKALAEVDKKVAAYGYYELLEQGIHYFKESEFKKASESFEQLYKWNPNDENALFYDALCASSQNQYAKASKILQKLSSNLDGFFYEEAKWNLALLELEAGNKDKAFKLLKEIEAAKGIYYLQAAQKRREFK